MNIRRRLFRLVFAAWLPAALAIAIVGRVSYVDERNASLEDVQRIGDGVADTVERELDKRAVMAKALGSSHALGLHELETFYGEARRATQDSDSWAMLLTSEQQILNTARPFDANLSVSMSEGSPWLEAGNNVYFSMKGPVVGKPLIGVAAAQTSGDIRYRIVVAFEPAVLQTIVTRQASPHKAVVTVMDSKLRVMARSVNPTKWLGLEITTPLRQRALKGGSGFGKGHTLDGVPSLTYLSKPNGYGWYAVVAVPAEALNQQAQNAAIKAVSLAVGLLGVSLLCALYVARSIAKPILALKRAADELAAEQVPAPMKTGLLEADEVARALRDAGLRAKESTDLLEARVNEAVARTAEVQTKLAEAQKREAIGRLAGGIAHDFNNLLQTISAAHHLLLPTTPEGPPRRMLEAASRATGKATGLVKQMLSFGRVQALQPEPLDIQDFLLKLSEFSSKAAGPSVTLRAHIEPNLPALFVDQTQLELALLNLIFNARDAMRNGGHIDIRASWVEAQEAGASTPAQSHCIRLDVQDDGPGMDAATLQKAFDPYFTTKPVGAGSGLGLAQVLAFARQSGGDARITSAPGQGTTVHMYLPATQRRPSADHVEAGESTTKGPPLRVLMVEDDPLLASVVAPAIEAAGHTVTCCQSGDEAKLILRAGDPFDVVFSDVVMPGATTGFDLAKWCQDEHPDLAVVLATGYSAQAPLTDVTVLKKPYHLDELLGALRAARAQRHGS